MAFIHHIDVKVRFQQQEVNAREYVLPFIESVFPIKQGMRVLEIGCAEGGVLVPFIERGCRVTGIELEAIRAEWAQGYLREYIEQGKAEIINLNIYNEAALQQYRGVFDLIILKDVIEHIPDQGRFIPYMKQFLKPGGHVFFGFPPWYMPHGGHQQICSSKLLTFLPYFHLLPVPVYKWVLRMFGEHDGTIKELMDIKSTGISIERFEKIVRRSGYKVEKSTHFLINPIYRYKFGLKPRRQWELISRIPFFRDFVTTCVYYLVRSDG